AMWITQSRMSAVENEVYVIATNAEPSVIQLDAARDALDQLENYADEYVDALGAAPSDVSGLSEKVSMARRQLHRTLDVYERLPFFPREKALYAEVTNVLGPIDEAVNTLLQQGSANQLEAARTTLKETLRPHLDRADQAMAHVIE